MTLNPSTHRQMHKAIGIGMGEPLKHLRSCKQSSNQMTRGKVKKSEKPKADIDDTVSIITPKIKDHINCERHSQTMDNTVLVGSIFQGSTVVDIKESTSNRCVGNVSDESQVWNCF
jgi:hypothetical protein